MHQLARFFKALGDDTRLQLVALLAQQEPGRAACVGRLAEKLGVTTSNVSQHLRVLKDLGLVRGERRGYRIHYFLDQERLAAYQALTRDCLGEEFVVLPTRDHKCIQREESQTMCCCDPKSPCTHPEEQRNPSECTPELIRECHGDAAEHPCTSEEQEKSG
jgi:DNA-binding transcriptional ArsR family regulator